MLRTLGRKNISVPDLSTKNEQKQQGKGTPPQGVSENERRQPTHNKDNKHTCCLNYFFVMGAFSWKGLFWLSPPEGNDRIFGTDIAY